MAKHQSSMSTAGDWFGTSWTNMSSPRLNHPTSATSCHKRLPHVSWFIQLLLVYSFEKILVLKHSKSFGYLEHIS